MKNLLAFLVLGLLASIILTGCNRPPDAGASHNSATPNMQPAEKDDPASYTLSMTEDQWREKLNPREFAVLREKATEPAFTGEYDHFFQAGTYSCAACGLELFASDTKFDSGCGWPAFYAAKAGDRVKLIKDISFGMARVEVVCSRCGSHLGHVFEDAPQTPTGQRFCINSVSLKFTPAK